MKKIMLLVACFLFYSAISAQETRTCHTMDKLAENQKKDPSLKLKMQEIEKHTQNKIKQLKNTGAKLTGTVYTIPVVVHVVYSSDKENISEAQILSQIEVMNEDFRRTNSDKDNVWSQAADTEIQFCLAKVDPQGNPTNGITRKYSSRTGWGTSDDLKSTSAGGVSPWDPSKYLNMWVCNLGGGLLGYAQFPGGKASTDGVVMRTTAFGSSKKGSNFYLSAPFDLGRTTTHEVGHYLNLRHIWGDGDCSKDDYVSDTPNQSKSSSGCPTSQSTCGSKDMVQNYMDYSNDSCMNLYTLGQKQRMRSVLDAGGSRRSLALSDRCGSDQSCTPTTPTGLQVGSITETTASVSWSAVEDTTYDVRYRASGSSNWSTVEAATNSSTLSGLTKNTTYEVQVRSKCSGETSNYSASVTFKTNGDVTNPDEYCSATSEATDDYISKVEFGSISNSSGSDKYSDFTSKSTEVAPGASATVTITPAWNGGTYAEGYAIFIDYNQDKDFNDAGETVFTKSASEDKSITANFTVPANAKKGTTRVRIVMQYNEVPSACGSFDYGEVEDYSLVIGDGDGGGGDPVYCESKGNSTEYEYIDNVEIGGIRNASGDDKGYADYTDKVASVNRGTDSDIILSAGFAGSSYKEFWAVYVDFNQDGKFSDAEKVVTGTSEDGGNVRATISVPSDAKLGKTRMRVTMRYNSEGNVCGGFDYGEVEDYTVNITNARYAYKTQLSSAKPIGYNTAPSFAVYPNPANEAIQVKFRRNKNAAFKIFNITGGIVKDGILNESSIDVSNLSSGIYIIEAFDGQRKYTSKFVKK